MKKIKIRVDGAIRETTIDAREQIHLDGKTVAIAKLDLLPVTAQPVICAALNYAEHYTEVKDGFHHAPYKEPPKRPVFFIKSSNTLASHLADVQCPKHVDGIYTGAGLAFVTNRPASRVSREEGFDYIDGYTIFNDFTLAEVDYFRPPIKTKCIDSFGPVGPFIVAREEITDPHELAIKTSVNGVVRQSASTAGMRFPIPAIIENLTEFMTLPAGAVVVSGFPDGRVKVKPGDEVTVEIEQVGSLTNHIVTEAEYYKGLTA